MKTAFLLRHADAEIDARAISDSERPLNPRGQQAAELIGKHLAQRIEAPLLTLCSSARRTVETLEAVAARLSGELRESIEADLYLASCQTLLERLQQIDDAEASVLLIAHNPGIAELAASLVDGDGPEFERMRRTFPSAALAEIEFDLASWSQITSRCGALRQFKTPQDLA
jgi:phosphohistidine phosphatase